MKQAAFFLVTIASFLMAISMARESDYTQDRHPNRHREVRPQDLLPSDHGVETNRDFTNEIQFGLIEGLYKVKMGGLPDCTIEGMSIMRAILKLGAKIATSKTSEDDILNIVQLSFGFGARCNYFATVQGIIVSRYIATLMLEYGSFLGSIVVPFWRLGEYLTNFIDDLYVILTALTGFSAHTDMFNASLILGKVLKITFQLFMEGWIMQDFEISPDTIQVDY